MLNGTSFKPKLVKSAEEQAAVYAAGLQLVEVIDDNLATGRVHYRTKAGKLLLTLEEVVRAILAGKLMPATECAAWEQQQTKVARQPEQLAA